MKKKIHAALVLDRSSSMANVIDLTRKGVNEFIATAKNRAKELDADIRLTIVGFNCNARYTSYEKHGPVELIVDAEKASKVKKMTKAEVYANGATPMYEGIGYTIDHLKSKAKKGDSVFVGIFTDGANTDVFTYAPNVVSQMIEEQKEWTFAFIGANQDVESITRVLYIPLENAMSYENDRDGTRSAFYKLSRGFSKYLENTVAGKANGHFFNHEDESLALMTVKGLSVTMNMPEATDSDDESDELPPYAPVPAYVVDQYPACPSNWEHGSAKAGSYFVAAKVGCGIWFDFNKCQDNEYDIAAVTSVQGINPLTGQKTDQLRLEKYVSKCPIHDVDFRQDRYCPTCEFKWPSQNYIATTTQPRDRFWLDGFRTEDGKVRQYVFTEDMAKGVANNIIKNDRVFAIGIALYRSKTKKQRFNPYFKSREIETKTSSGLLRSAFSRPKNSFESRWTSSREILGSSGGTETQGFSEGFIRSKKCSAKPEQLGPISYSSDDADEMSRGISFTDSDIDRDLNELGIETSAKQYEVAAGANIVQQIHEDTSDINFWEEEPYCMIYINYTDQETVNKILAAGKRKDKSEGFLSGIPVGR